MAKSSKAPKKVIKTTSAKPKQTAATSSKSKSSGKRPMPASTEKKQAPAELPFTRTNYVLLIAGIALILFGFILMSVGDFVDATQFSVALHIAPIIVVGGFVEVIFAIMYRPRKASEPANQGSAEAA